MPNNYNKDALGHFPRVEPMFYLSDDEADAGDDLEILVHPESADLAAFEYENGNNELDGEEEEPLSLSEDEFFDVSLNDDKADDFVHDPYPSPTHREMAAMERYENKKQERLERAVFEKLYQEGELIKQNFDQANDELIARGVSDYEAFSQERAIHERKLLLPLSEASRDQSVMALQQNEERYQYAGILRDMECERLKAGYESALSVWRQQLEADPFYQQSQKNLEEYTRYQAGRAEKEVAKHFKQLRRAERVELKQQAAAERQAEEAQQKAEADRAARKLAQHLQSTAILAEQLKQEVVARHQSAGSTYAGSLKHFHDRTPKGNLVTDKSYRKEMFMKAGPADSFGKGSKPARRKLLIEVLAEKPQALTPESKQNSSDSAHRNTMRHAK